MSVIEKESSEEGRSHAEKWLVSVGICHLFLTDRLLVIVNSDVKSDTLILNAYNTKKKQSELWAQFPLLFIWNTFYGSYFNLHYIAIKKTL